MKKMKKSKSQTQKKTYTENPSAVADSVNAGRRDILGKIRNGAIMLGVLGGSGLFIARSVSSTIEEHDLTRVDNGRPTVVQIHDPHCPKCLNLQRQTRKALKQFDKEELDYVVANIRTAEGRGFQAIYGVPHVTLLLFDSEGELQSTLQGQRQSEDLSDAFRRLVSS